MIKRWQTRNPEHLTFEQRMYQSLKCKGLAPQFECVGIYAILLDGKIVYIGKSVNILMRMAQHYAQLAQGREHKYRILAEATRSGHKMCFTVLYRAKQTDYDAITEEIGNMEGRYIRLHRPPLNQQIPKEENWRQFQINKNAQTITLSELLDNIK